MLNHSSSLVDCNAFDEDEGRPLSEYVCTCDRQTEPSRTVPAMASCVMLETRSYVALSGFIAGSSMSACRSLSASSSMQNRDRRRRLTVIHDETLDGEIDDGWVALLDKVVLCEAPKVQHDKWRKLDTLEALDLTPGLLKRDAVVLGEDLADGDLRDNVLLNRVLEHRRGGQVDCKEEEWRSGHLDL